MKQDAIKSLFTRITNKAYVTVVQPMAEREFISGGGAKSSIHVFSL